MVRGHKHSGQSTYEFPVALLLFFMFMLLPLMGLLGMFLKYTCGWYLNYLQARQAAMGVVIEAVPPAIQGQPPTYQLYSQNGYVYDPTKDLNSVTSGWVSGFGAFACGSSVSAASLIPPFNKTGQGNGKDNIPGIYVLLGTNASTSGNTPLIEVGTTVPVQPFINFQNVPFLSKVPGLGAPFNFGYQTTLPAEQIVNDKGLVISTGNSG